ncbi:hypothetical protein MDA_GLEAN10010004 [Myotis davidii]|uniref:Uncharacterized protein n=1 Tax=Myotis davidii TaxID=225400 RepID=L5LPY1_MYODS|nr:hypothetical protein MDA_GLEAN10010004 [Myotis davidii]
MREKHRSAASCTSTGDVPAIQVHALDRNRTRDPSVRRPTLYPLSQTGFGGKDTQVRQVIREEGGDDGAMEGGTEGR